MSYAVCRMQKVKSAGLKGMQFHNQRERKSRTNDDIDHHDLSYKDSERFMLVIREAIFSRIACNDILIVIMILPYSQ